jgi:hypothetical protein
MATSDDPVAGGAVTEGLDTPREKFSLVVNGKPINVMTGGNELEIFIRNEKLTATFGPLNKLDWEIRIREHKPQKRSRGSSGKRR